MATAFRSSHDGKPEPLCAIYEPGSHAAIDAWVRSGQRCPRGFLAQANVALLTLRQPRALDNVNTAEEYSAAQALLRGAPSQATARGIRVQYFALLREQAGRSEETVVTSADTPRELYGELRARYPFSLGVEMLRVAINSEFAEWSRSLQNGDSIVFIPPVAGG
ncbi:MAG: MoaD/ThiS family protein [Sinobacteraceae bacterium]|nr:MoaD/ThiS family protein [Nevskiaceae bacterium]